MPNRASHCLHGHHTDCTGSRCVTIDQPACRTSEDSASQWTAPTPISTATAKHAHRLPRCCLSGFTTISSRTHQSKRRCSQARCPQYSRLQRRRGRPLLQWRWAHVPTALCSATTSLMPCWRRTSCNCWPVPRCRWGLAHISHVAMGKEHCHS